MRRVRVEDEGARHPASRPGALPARTRGPRSGARRPAGRCAHGARGLVDRHQCTRSRRGGR